MSASRAQLSGILAASAGLLIGQSALALESTSVIMQEENAMVQEVKTIQAEIANLDQQINDELAAERSEEAQLYTLDRQYTAALKAGNMEQVNSIRAQVVAVKAEEDANKLLRRRLLAEDAKDVVLLQEDMLKLAALDKELVQAENRDQLVAEEKDLAKVVGDENFSRVSKFFVF